MKIDKILYATDFSPNSLAGLRYASTFAADTGATLLIVHVDDTTPGLVFGDVGYGFVPQVDEIAKEEYEQLKEISPTHESVRYEHRFLRGVAADGILRVAVEEQVGLIVIGTHGRSGVSRMLMGSVAAEVVRRAKCPVLTIKEPLEYAAKSSSGKREVGRS